MSAPLDWAELNNRHTTAVTRASAALTALDRIARIPHAFNPEIVDAVTRQATDAVTELDVVFVALSDAELANVVYFGKEAES